MAKRPKKFGLKVKAKITPGTKKKAGEGKEEVGLTKELQESQRIKINKEGKKVILSGQEEKVERDKKLMMWAGVSFFMVLILALWVLNIKSIFKEVKNPVNNSSRFEWNKISDEFGQTMEQIKKGLSELKQIDLENKISTTTEEIGSPLFKDNNTGSPINDQLQGEDSLLELKERLEELEENLDNKN